MKQIAIEIDPNEVHIKKGASYQTLAEACGVLPLWALAGMGEGITMRKSCLTHYQFPVSKMGGVIDENGVYLYPEDPPLYPYIKMTIGKETAYFYDHAMIGFVHPEDKEEQYVVRMD